MIQNSYQWLMGEIDKSQLVMMGSGQTEYAEVLSLSLTLSMSVSLSDGWWTD